jgi:hypothetical protein
MPKCSVYSCSETPIGGFQERIDISNFFFPRRSVSVGTYYWCRQHEELLSAVEGRIGIAIDLQAIEAGG